LSESNPQRIVIVGASAAGLKAAARARRLLPNAVVTILDERDFVSYGACGLPYYLSGDVEDLDALRKTNYGAVRDPEYFSTVKGLHVQTGFRVERLDPAARQIFVRDLQGEGESVLSYDALVLATGAGPRSLPGVEVGEAVGFFHMSEDAHALRRGLETGSIGEVVVVGAGFIGCELAGAFGELWGCDVTLVEAAPWVLPQILDADMATLAAGELRRNDVALHLGAPVTRAVTEQGRAVVEAGGKIFTSDRAVVAVGVQPRVDLAVAAGLQIGTRGALVVDGQLRTSLPQVYAAGDCIEVIHAVSGRPCYLPLGSLANRQGRVVGDNLAGIPSRFGTVAGSVCLKIFDWNVAATGLSEQQARADGLAARAAWGSFFDRAHYHPEHKMLFLKLVYEKSSRRLLGLQALGKGDAVKRVDVFSSLLLRGGRLEDLLDLEFCYSPPYNAALDPLHGMACVALNREERGLTGIGPSSVEPGGEAPGGRFVMDLRLAEEITAEEPALPGALNIPIHELRARMAEIPRDRPLLCVCAMGTRSAEAGVWLASQGFQDIVYLAGGMNLQNAR
jgi:NADPH-dependent 2,4-dienoyl-CoA reductase/sulfur reductase-like enzyme/rhodanese-related sulfurtransferase